MTFKQLPVARQYQTCSWAVQRARTNFSAFMSSPLNRILLTAAGCAVVGGLGTYLYAKSEARRYRLEKMRITTFGGSTNGKPPISLKILHLSDLHLSAPESAKIEFLQRVTDEDFDLAVITGDIFENYSGIEYAGRLLARKPRLGAFAVLGNHDYFNYTWFNKTVGRFNRKFRHPPQRRDVQPMIEALEAAGITVLRNSAITIPEHKVHLIGLDYPGTTEQNLKSLVAQAPEDFLIMSLLHLPRRLHQLPNAGVHLAFAGHTHGGQIRVPGLGALFTDSELHRSEASGVVRRGNTVIHVSRGLSADPKTNIRLFCPPAATLLHVEHHPKG